MAMETQQQALIWSFITLYKQVIGDSLSYIQLVEDPTKLYDALARVRGCGNEELIRYGERISQQFDQLQPRQAQLELHTDQAAREANTQKGELDYALEGYGEQLRTLLADGLITFEQRRELDRYCKLNRIHWQQAQECESSLRRSLKMPVNNWSEELMRGVRECQRSDQGLTQRDHMRLFDTYIKRGRLSMAHAEQILSDAERTISEFVPLATRKEPPRLLLTLGSAALLVFAMILGLPWVGPVALLDGVQDVTADASAVPQVQHISGSIMQETQWHANTTYYLDDIVFVEGGARLSIEPGTTIRGGFGSALIVTRDATLYARGTRDAPIIFTSAKPEGSRDRGDWGGVVLLGNAPINRPTGQIEGINRLDVRGSFGGGDASSNCGTLEYVRIEFAGYEVFANNELNGLTFGGCGNTTIVRYVQVHRALDDGIEVFGGEVDMSHILITGARDDSLDWDMGWRGRVQFLLIQQYADAGDNAIEADNSKKKPNATPRSAPTLYNVSLIGDPRSQLGQRAMTLRRGTGGVLRNLLITGFPLEAIDIRDEATAVLTSSGQLSISHALIENIGPSGTDYFLDESGEQDDDAGLNELAWLSAAEREVHFGVSSQLTARINDLASPLYIPLSRPDGVTRSAVIPQDEFWDQGADYLGAIRPGMPSSWLSGWSAYPIN